MILVVEDERYKSVLYGISYISDCVYFFLYRVNSAGRYVSKVLALALVTACNTCRSAQRVVKILLGGQMFLL